MALPSRVRTLFRRAALACAVLAAALFVWFIVEGGRYLQHEDPLAHADAMFVLAGARAERWIPAIDLYRQGYAPLIVLSPGRVEDAEIWLRQRGIRFPTDAELSRDAMVQMGVPASAVTIPQGSVDSTSDEAVMLRQIALARGWKRIIVLTSKFHCRRTGFAMRRELKGTDVAVIVRASPYDTADPARWWATRSDIRWVTLEWQKLIAYWCGLGS